MSRRRRRQLRWLPPILGTMAFLAVLAQRDAEPSVLVGVAVYVVVAAGLAGLDIAVARYREARWERQLLQSIAIHPSGAHRQPKRKAVV